MGDYRPRIFSPSILEYIFPLCLPLEHLNPSYSTDGIHHFIETQHFPNVSLSFSILLEKRRSGNLFCGMPYGFGLGPGAIRYSEYVTGDSDSIRTSNELSCRILNAKMRCVRCHFQRMRNTRRMKNHFI